MVKFQGYHITDMHYLERGKESCTKAGLQAMPILWTGQFKVCQQSRAYGGEEKSDAAEVVNYE